MDTKPVHQKPVHTSEHGPPLKKPRPAHENDKIIKKEKLKHARPDKPVKPVSVKKESTPVKRKPMISESESEDDVPLALKKVQLQKDVSHAQQPDGKVSVKPATVKKERKIPVNTAAVKKEPVKPAVVKKEHKIPSVKKESGTSASEDDVPLAKKKHELAKQMADHKPIKPPPPSSSSPSKPRKPTESPQKAGTKRKRTEDESETDEEFKPKKSKKAEGKSPAAKKSVKITSPKKEQPSPVKGGGGRKKKEEEKEVWKWWEETPHPEGVKWLTLEHKGPYFAPLYEPLPEGVQFVYDGVPMKLSEKAEEAAGFFGKMLDHEYTKKDIFCQNFFQDWRKEMTRQEADVIRKWEKCDFTQIYEFYKERSEQRKQMSKEEKAAVKAENEKVLAEYGWAIIDGHRERIGNFKVEPPGLFRGRGDHPKQGKIKKRIEAEDVIINIGKDAPVPEPPPNHRWKLVQHDNKVTWLASWTENIQGQIKYVMLNPTSRLKGEKDWAKYETARKLKDHVELIRQKYKEDWKSPEMKVRQRAVAVYFIDKLALRAGNEKDADESADTVGCCSLRVEHIKLHEELEGKENVVEFDFLGKDSIRYYNSVQVERQVFKNVGIFMREKIEGDDLFDRLTTTELNRHLSELMPGLTAKVFRTFNASKTLQEQLDELTEEKDPVPKKLLSYNRANRAVAILCNHQRAPPKTFDQQMSNLQAKITAKEESILEAKSELKALKKEVKTTKDPKLTKKLESKKKQLERLKDQLQKLEVQATDKEENKEIALGTSKLNYLDPRISVAWCKKWEVPVEKIYNKSQRDKFAWAIDMAGEDFVF